MGHKHSTILKYTMNCNIPIKLIKPQYMAMKLKPPILFPEKTIRNRKFRVSLLFITATFEHYKT